MSTKETEPVNRLERSTMAMLYGTSGNSPESSSTFPEELDRGSRRARLMTAMTYATPEHLPESWSTLPEELGRGSR